MVEVCPVPNITILSNTEWDKDEELGFVMDAFVASDILIIVSITVLYLYCTKRKKKTQHFELPVTVAIGSLTATENKYSIISFKRTSCPSLFT